MCGLVHSTLVRTPVTFTGLVPSNSAENEWWAKIGATARTMPPVSKITNLALVILSPSLAPSPSEVIISCRTAVVNASGLKRSAFEGFTWVAGMTRVSGSRLLPDGRDVVFEHFPDSFLHRVLYLPFHRVLELVGIQFDRDWLSRDLLDHDLHNGRDRRQ